MSIAATASAASGSKPKPTPCDNKTGLPYTRHDGYVNPEISKYDIFPLTDMWNTTNVLSLAYYFSGIERYAARCALLLRVWFLDAATKMNPNGVYAQAIPGVTRGQHSVLIDFNCRALVASLCSRCVCGCKGGFTADATANPPPAST